MGTTEKILGLALLVSLALPGCKKKEPGVIPTEPTPIVEKAKPSSITESYTVKEGDHFWSIGGFYANKLYKSPSRTDSGNVWADICWDNKGKIKDWNLIYSGQVFDIDIER